MKPENVKEILGLILLKEGMSISQLAKIISEKTGKKIYQQSLSYKLRKGTLKFNEMLLICKILGYEISFNKIKKH